jgi:hypothetical protein
VFAEVHEHTTRGQRLLAALLALAMMCAFSAMRQVAAN